jgi:hypothetical protein
MDQFQVGQVYFGSLPCAHGHFPVLCTKRTAKCVWFEHATLPHAYKPARSLVREGMRYKCANFHGWLITADQRDSSMDMQFA